MSKPFKIAIYSGSIPSTTFIERLVDGLANKGFHIYRFGLQKNRSKTPKNIFNFTYNSKFSKLFVFFKYSFLLILYKTKDKKRLDEIIASQFKSSIQQKIKYYPVLYHRPDVFHLQWAKSIVDWMWVQNFGIKLIVSLRGAHINYSPIADLELATLYKNLFPKVNAFHAVSRAIVKEATKYNASEEKIKIIYSGLDLKQIGFHFKSFDPKSPLNIISVGRAHWIKGYSYALDAMNLLYKKEVQFNYTIVGVDKDEELIYKQSQFECKNKINFIENLPFSEVKELINKADILLLPSVEEGIANVVLEAMALGTLVISTACGGMDEVIINNKNGFLVPIRNSEAIAIAIKKVSKLSESEYSRLTQEARKTVENKHNEAYMIEDMKNLYQLVLKDKL